jgi:hypothetical protein
VVLRERSDQALATKNTTNHKGHNEAVKFIGFRRIYNELYRRRKVGAQQEIIWFDLSKQYLFSQPLELFQRNHEENPCWR